MTKQEFQELTQNIVLLDGATGSNLMAAGMPKGVCTEEWVLAHKDVIQNLQRAYIEAGSNIIYAPTFGGNRVSLTMHGLQDRMEEINRTLVSYSREVADAADHKVYVAADITTSGKMMAPAGEMTYEAAFEMYQEQIGILKDSGVDLIVADHDQYRRDSGRCGCCFHSLRAADYVYHDGRRRRKYFQRWKCYRGCCFPGGCRCRCCGRKLLCWSGSAGFCYPQY